MNIAAAREIYEDVRLQWGSVPVSRFASDPREKFIELLEIGAVRAGLKRSYLGGQSHPEGGALERLSETAGMHGLSTAWNFGLGEWSQIVAERELQIDEAFVTHACQREREELAKGPRVLWIFADESTRRDVDACVLGEVAT